MLSDFGVPGVPSRTEEVHQVVARDVAHDDAGVRRGRSEGRLRLAQQQRRSERSAQTDHESLLSALLGRHFHPMRLRATGIAAVN